MSLSDFIGGLVGDSGSGVETNTFECRDCGATFDSAKSLDRLQCPECLSGDVTQAE